MSLEPPVDTTKDSPLLPAEACDTHMHFYSSRYPVAGTTVLRPPDATVDDYRGVQGRLGCRRVVVVQPTTYGLDNACQLDAMAELQAAPGHDQVRGIAVVTADTSAAELRRLDGLGVRGARFHMLPGGAVDWDQLEPVVDAVYPLGWHIQLQLNGRELTDREPQLQALRTPLVIDHVGRFMPPVDVDHSAFTALRRLLGNGRTWVKISAPYESSAVGAPDYPDTAVLARALVDEFPERMLWASNWPHPGQVTFPSPPELLGLLIKWIPLEHRRRVLVDNPASLYGFSQ